jgi:beta-lactam-binding protein with PASTA domain
MANWKLIGGIAGGVIVLGVIGNAVNHDNTDTTSSRQPATSQVTTADNKASAAKAEKKTVPDLVGMGLQSAQDAAQAAGFYNLDSHDALGRGRNQILDRDWKVCSQNIKAGTNTATSTELDLGAVKLAETCPAKDETPPSAAGGKMPNFAGKSVKAARQALDSSTSITVNDASGAGRWVLVESNWKVCSQKPAAGTRLNGQPVELDAVKYEESCP